MGPDVRIMIKESGNVIVPYSKKKKLVFLKGNMVRVGVCACMPFSDDIIKGIRCGILVLGYV